MNFNDYLLNGDMEKVRCLVADGQSWSGSKRHYGLQNIKHPSNKKDFAEQIKVILDIGLYDSNYNKDEPFVWFFQPTDKQVIAMLSLDKIIDDLTLSTSLSAYLFSYKFTQKEKENNLEDETVCSPQLCVYGTKGSYFIRVETYPKEQYVIVDTVEVNEIQLLTLVEELVDSELFIC